MRSKEDIPVRLYPCFAEEIGTFFEFLTKIYQEA